MKTGLGDDIDLDGGVTTGVVDLTSVDLCDGHTEILRAMMIVRSVFTDFGVV